VSVIFATLAPFIYLTYFSVPNIYFIFFYEQIFKMIYEHITKEMKIKPVFP